MVKTRSGVNTSIKLPTCDDCGDSFRRGVYVYHNNAHYHHCSWSRIVCSKCGKGYYEIPFTPGYGSDSVEPFEVIDVSE